MPENGHLTPTHVRMMAVLADGQAHTAQELTSCLWDELSDESTVLRHISTLRKALRSRSECIVTHRDSQHVTTYQLGRLLASPYDE